MKELNKATSTSMLVILSNYTETGWRVGRRRKEGRGTVFKAGDTEDKEGSTASFMSISSHQC